MGAAIVHCYWINQSERLFNSLYMYIGTGLNGVKSDSKCILK